MLLAAALTVALAQGNTQFSFATRPPADGSNRFYAANKAPLNQTPLVKLPIGAIKPGGWVRKSLELQRDGLTGHLGEISIWLTKKNNAWLNKDGKGEHGWEEVPYWLRGYARIAIALHDPKMLAETKFWVDGTLNSQRQNGDFGPDHNHSQGFRDLWANMLMLQVLQSWYEYSNDPRVLPFMTSYFRYELSVPDSKFLKDYWENSRGGENLASVYWLFNRTGDSFLLDLATKIDRNTADWRQLTALPNYHNVNVAESFREPAEFFQQSGKSFDLLASYRDFDLMRHLYGQVPGGMFGADENARPGHDDPHQAVETCGMVEQIGSNDILEAITADPKWAANTEDVAFNTLPAAFTEDYRALRYLTAPNMAVSDAKDHAPGLDNGGPFLLMNPFSSRCCQHNSSSAWVNYLEGSWMATQDNGLAALLFQDGEVIAKVGNGETATIKTETHYPFEETVRMSVALDKTSQFPLYLLIPSWAVGATVTVGDETLDVSNRTRNYVKISRLWHNGDRITIHLPMRTRIRTWPQMKGAWTVDYGPLTFSLKIEEKFHRVDGLKATESDSGWQPGVDQSKWPTYEILPGSDWNYALAREQAFVVKHKAWPKNDYPFTLANTPLELVADAYKLPDWKLDESGLVGALPQSPVKASTPKERVVLIPMGAALLRISSFPVVE